MTPVAQKITLSLEQRQIEAYQLSADGQIQLLFTHRQIGEAVGKTKEAAQRFLKQQSDLLSEPLKAKIPSKPHPVPLTPLSSAKAYWKCLAQKGNETAIALIEALDKNCLEELLIISPEEPTSSETSNDDHSKVTAASVNKALHELGLQEWSNRGQSRERKLTDSGKQYGVAVLATSESGWQGGQIRWNESVIPVLMKYLR
jgi:hypothetical protein